MWIRKSFINIKSYCKNMTWTIFARDFGILCGFLTVVGLYYGIISYHQTVKPEYDFRNLRAEVAELKEEKEILEGEVDYYTRSIKVLEQENLAIINENTEAKEELLELTTSIDQMGIELLDTNFYNYVNKIVINNRSSYEDENAYVNVEKFIEQEKERSSVTESQKRAIDIIEMYLKENLNETSNYDDFMEIFHYYLEYKFENNLF